MRERCARTCLAHHAPMSTTQRWLLALALLVVGGVALWVAVPQVQGTLEPFLEAETWREWREWLRSFGILAPLVSIGLSVAQIVPLPIPAPTLPMANGWLFGIGWGTLVTWTGVMLNSMLGYWLARGPGRRALQGLVPTRHLRRAERALEQHGAWAVLLARMIPVLPFSAISVAAGLLHMRWREYVLATAVGVLPSAFALALIGYQLSRGRLDWREVGLAVVILAGLALAAIPVSRWLRNERDK